MEGYGPIGTRRDSSSDFDSDFFGFQFLFSKLNSVSTLDMTNPFFFSLSPSAFILFPTYCYSSCPYVISKPTSFFQPIKLQVVKTDDRSVARELGVTTFPSLVYYRRKNPITYDGDFKDSETVLRWLRSHEEVRLFRVLSEFSKLSRKSTSSRMIFSIWILSLIFSEIDRFI